MRADWVRGVADVHCTSKSSLDYRACWPYERGMRRTTRGLVFAVSLAAVLALVPQSVLAAENRPEAPVVVSPTPQQITVLSGDLVVSGTGTPGDTAYVARFGSGAD